jgi:hypothetical protein
MNGVTNPLMCCPCEFCCVKNMPHTRTLQDARKTEKKNGQ